MDMAFVRRRPSRANARSGGATGYPILSVSDLVGFTVTLTGDLLEVTSGDLTGVGAAGDSAALVWNGANGHDWTGVNA